MKICLTCSHGGHLTEILKLMDAFEGHDVFFITYEGTTTKNLKKKYTFNNFGENYLRALYNVPKLISIFINEKPEIIISTGAEIAVPVFYLAKLFGCKTMFIESWTRVCEPTVTGKLVYPISDVFLVQWPELLDKYGRKSQYKGRLL
jgi:beta-1,4-N-acetylglucosaminyltransferase